MNANLSLIGQTALVTGGTDGIGRQVVLRLAQLGAQVIIVGRNAQRGQQTIDDVHASVPHSDLSFIACDLSLMDNACQLGERIQAQYPTLDIVVHCAGLTLRKRTLTHEHLETVFALQYLARFSLTRALLPALQASRRGRVVNVSGGGNVKVRFDFDNLNGEKRYNGVDALQHEAVANDMQILEFAQSFPDVRFYGYGPGYVPTALLHDLSPLFQWVSRTAGLFIGYTPEKAADDILTLVMAAPQSGLYTRRTRRNQPTRFTGNRDNRQRLWQISEQLLESAVRSHQPPIA